MQPMKGKWLLFTQLIIALLICTSAWVATLVVNPYLNPIVEGLTRTEAVRENFSPLPLLYSIATLSGYFIGNAVICIWMLKGSLQLYSWSIFLGIYAGVMLLPSYRSQIISEYFEAHFPKALGIAGDLLLFVGVPLLAACAIRAIEKWGSKSH
jgi:hypothetical protein